MRQYDYLSSHSGHLKRARSLESSKTATIQQGNSDRHCSNRTRNHFGTFNWFLKSPSGDAKMASGSVLATCTSLVEFSSSTYNLISKPSSRRKAAGGSR